MGETEYSEALKLGKKEYRARIAKGQFPYLPVLDEILSEADIQTEQNMGLVQVPLDFVVGTSTMGRTYSFAANFMPILDEETEFAVKWSNLSDAQMNEGIRDPIKAFEYMNRYYVLEGNKRVSVLKYFNAVAIPAIVTRKIPKLSDDYDVRLYYEYMKFNEITGLCSVEFTKLGNAYKLLSLVGKEGRWDDETKEKFAKVMFDFSKVYNFRGGDRLDIKLGDAITVFMEVFGMDAMLEMSENDYNKNIINTWKEFAAEGEKHKINLVLDPKKVQTKKSLLNYLIPQTPKKLKVVFLYPREPKTSAWLYSHELGRMYLDETFSDKLETEYVAGVDENNVEQVLEDIIKSGADIVFCVGPQMMPNSLKVAVEHPEVYILNCSLNAPHPYIRTYYGRMYEAKFLAGMIAGAVTDNERVAYIADYPIYGMIANINAFALGVASVNPRAKVYLAWSKTKDYDRNKFLEENDLHYVSDQDIITPNDASRYFGLYKLQDGQALNLAMPIWNWGVFYEKLLQSVLAGSYKAEGQEQVKALNYWWGMSAGVIDLICSKHVPYGVKRLADHLKSDITKGEIVPFFGQIYNQKGELKNKGEHEMKPSDIMKMDWLVDNVVGSIPPMSEFIDNAKMVVELKGVEGNKL